MARTFEYFRVGEVLGGDTLGGSTMEYWRGGEVHRFFAPDSGGTDRRAHLSWAEIESPLAPRRTFVTFGEFEVPLAPRRAQVAFAEIETPLGPRRVQIAWAEVESPLAPRRGQIYWTELESPFLQHINAPETRIVVKPSSFTIVGGSSGQGTQQSKFLHGIGMPL